MTFSKIAVLCFSGIFFLVKTSARAQSGVSLYHLGTKTIQINQFNPAHQADGTFHLALPFISKQSVSVSNAFSFNDIFKKTGAGKYRLLNEKLYDLAGDNGFLGFEVDKMTLFQMGFKVPSAGLGVTFFSNLSSSNRFYYSKGLFQLLLGGTAQSIGKELMAEDGQLSSMTYGDVGFGMQKSLLGNRLKVGANLKYLAGVAYLQSDEALGLSLRTNPDTYAMTFHTRNVAFDYSLPVGRAGVSLADQEEWTSNFSLTKNPGVAVDLGATYAVLNKLDVSVAVTDLGAITWKEVSREYVEDKTFTFSGVDIEENDEDLIDSLEQHFKLKYLAKGEKKSSLPTRFLLSAKYSLTKNDVITASYFGVKDPREMKSLVALGYTRSFGNAVAATVNVIKAPQRPVGLGVGTALTFFGTQVYVATDNFLGALKVSDTRGTDLRFGINFIIDNASPSED